MLIYFQKESMMSYFSKSLANLTKYLKNISQISKIAFIKIYKGKKNLKIPKLYMIKVEHF